MCTAYAGMAMQLVGGLYSAYGAKAEHKANAYYLDASSKINQMQTENAIDSLMYASGMQASGVRAEGHSVAKEQIAGMASRGMGSDSFTYQNILDASIVRSEQDAQAILYNADIQAKNMRLDSNIKSIQYQAQADAERRAGKMAFQTGLLSTAGQFAQSYAKWEQTSMGKAKEDKKFNWRW